MKRQKFVATLACSIFIVAGSTLAQADFRFNRVSAQSKDQSKKKKDAESLEAARSVMWQEPRDLERRDLYFGPGGRAGAPDDNGRYTFLRESKSGTQKKIIVKDNRGREWTVKFGEEARPETAASRIVWAVGYHADQDYFVRRALIEGKERYDARDVRFERRDDGTKEVGNWNWKSNPFAGTRELDGLKVLMALLKNWDLKSDNNKTSRLKGKDGAGGVVYYVSDLGATLGRTGSFLNNFPVLNKVLFLGDLPADHTPIGAGKSKGDAEAFAEEKFISDVRNGEVKFHVERTRCKEIFKGVKVENARWIGNLLGRLSDKQLRDAFRSGGFDDFETNLYVYTLRERIRALQRMR